MSLGTYRFLNSSHIFFQTPITFGTTINIESSKKKKKMHIDNGTIS